MHEYTKDAIAEAGRRCEISMQLAHMFGREDVAVGAYYAAKARQEALYVSWLVEKDSPARACFPQLVGCLA